MGLWDGAKELYAYALVLLVSNRVRDPVSGLADVPGPVAGWDEPAGMGDTCGSYTAAGLPKILRSSALPGHNPPPTNP